QAALAFRALARGNDAGKRHQPGAGDVAISDPSFRHASPREPRFDILRPGRDTTNDRQSDSYAETTVRVNDNRCGPSWPRKRASRSDKPKTGTASDHVRDSKRATRERRGRKTQ